MKISEITLLDLDYEYKLWKNRLQYIHQDMVVLKERILELHSADDKVRKPGVVIETRVESLLNKSDVCLRSIKVHEEEASYYAREYPIDQQHQHYQDHEKVRAEVKLLWEEYIAVSDEFLRKFA